MSSEDCFRLSSGGSSVLKTGQYSNEDSMQLSGIISLCISAFLHCLLWTLAAFSSPDAQLCFLNSGRPLSSAWGLPPCTVARNSLKTVGVTVGFYSSLMSNVVKTHIFCSVTLVVSGEKVNLDPFLHLVQKRESVPDTFTSVSLIASPLPEIFFFNW